MRRRPVTKYVRRSTRSERPNQRRRRVASIATVQTLLSSALNRGSPRSGSRSESFSSHSRCPKPLLTDFSRHAIASSFSPRSEEHTSELQSRPHLVCRLLLEKKNNETFAQALLRILETTLFAILQRERMNTVMC